MRICKCTNRICGATGCAAYAVGALANSHDLNVKKWVSLRTIAHRMYIHPWFDGEYFFSLFGREFTGCVFDVMLFRETAWRRTATFRKPLFLLAEWLQLQTSIPWCLYDFIYFCVPRLTVPVKYTLYSTCMCQAIIFFGDMFHLVRETSLFRDSAKVSLARESCARNDVNVSTMLFTVCSWSRLTSCRMSYYFSHQWFITSWGCYAIQWIYSKCHTVR